MARRRTTFQKKTAYYGWVGVSAVNAGFATTNVLLTFIASGIAATIRRTRGVLVVQLEASAATDLMMTGFGLAVVSDSARIAGAASLPSPMDDLTFPWYWHKFVPLIPTSATQADNTGAAASARIEIDAKAMRKIRPNEAVVLMADGLQSAGSPIAACSVGIRVLFDNQ